MKISAFLLFAACAVLSTVGAVEPAAPQTIIFFGDSITAGYGLQTDKAYPALIQKKIDALKWPYRCINAGMSGDTTSAGMERLNWTLRQKVDILVLALGGNDGLRGIPAETTKKNIQEMINLSRKKWPNIKVVLAGMQMPPNYGEVYTKRFAAIFPELAKENKLTFIPYLLDGVGGISKYNLPDRIHPTELGQEMIAETVWKTLKPVLGKQTPKK